MQQGWLKRPKSSQSPPPQLSLAFLTISDTKRNKYHT